MSKRGQRDGRTERRRLSAKLRRTRREAELRLEALERQHTHGRGDATALSRFLTALSSGEQVFQTSAATHAWQRALPAWVYAGINRTEWGEFWRASGGDEVVGIGDTPDVEIAHVTHDKQSRTGIPANMINLSKYLGKRK